mmetsp:Transcript_4958/g.14287  ORF Transcript_4958/g.14287 Transcript_4958/m.14287 type:complete len:202 (-) Transcript_4958:1518-2123(-)
MRSRSMAATSVTLARYWATVVNDAIPRALAFTAATCSFSSLARPVLVGRDLSSAQHCTSDMCPRLARRTPSISSFMAIISAVIQSSQSLPMARLRRMRSGVARWVPSLTHSSSSSSSDGSVMVASSILPIADRMSSRPSFQSGAKAIDSSARSNCFSMRSVTLLRRSCAASYPSLPFANVGCSSDSSKSMAIHSPTSLEWT